MADCTECIQLRARVEELEGEVWTAGEALSALEITRDHLVTALNSRWQDGVWELLDHTAEDDRAFKLVQQRIHTMLDQYSMSDEDATTFIHDATIVGLALLQMSMGGGDEK